MALSDRQWQVRDLVMGPGTAYRLMDETNPFVLTTRADQGGPRAWNHGGWSGAEWANERVVPMRILVETDTLADWRDAHQLLASAFSPVADSGDQVELRFALGGTEYLLLGRPRMVEPDVSLIGAGKSFTRCAFVAQDPRIYSGVEQSAGPLGLPSQAGGMFLSLLLPLSTGGTLIGGRVDLTNDGTTDTGLLLRIDGPVPEPRVTLLRPDGEVQTLRWAGLTIPSGQWLEVDTASRTAFLNGLEGASRFPGFVDWPLLPPGTSTLRFGAADDDTGTLTVTYRHAWW